MLLPVVYWCRPDVTSLLVPSAFSKKLSHTLHSSAKLPHRELSFAGLPSAVSYCFAKLDRDLRRMDEILGTLNDNLKACREWKIGPGWNPNHWCKYLLPYWFYQNLCGNVEREHISKIPLSASCSSSFNLWFATSPCKGNHYFKSYGVNHRATHADHFGATDYVEFEALKSEWEQFKFVTQDLKTECPMTITPQPGNTPTEWLLTMLCSIPSFKVMFPNLLRLSAVAQSLSGQKKAQVHWRG